MTRRCNRTLELTTWSPPEVTVGYGPEVAGRGALDSKISRLLGQALRDARDEKGLNRSEIAGLMTLELHRSITEEQLDKWSSEASTSHRIPLDAFAALVKVVQADGLVNFIPSLLDLVVVPQRYAEIIELHLIEDKERELAAHKASLQAKLRGRS